MPCKVAALTTSDIVAMVENDYGEGRVGNCRIWSERGVLASKGSYLLGQDDCLVMGISSVESILA